MADKAEELEAECDKMSAFDDWFTENYPRRDRYQTMVNGKEAFNAGLEAAVTLAEKQAEWKLAHAIRALKGG